MMSAQHTLPANRFPRLRRLKGMPLIISKKNGLLLLHSIYSKYLLLVKFKDSIGIGRSMMPKHSKTTHTRSQMKKGRLTVKWTGGWLLPFSSILGEI
jgi:hypothetical protein